MVPERLIFLECVNHSLVIAVITSAAEKALFDMFCYVSAIYIASVFTVVDCDIIPKPYSYCEGMKTFSSKRLKRPFKE